MEPGAALDADLNLLSGPVLPESDCEAAEVVPSPVGIAARTSSSFSSSPSVTRSLSGSGNDADHRSPGDGHDTTGGVEVVKDIGDGCDKGGDDDDDVDAETEPATSAFSCPDSAVSLSNPGISADVDNARENSNNAESDPSLTLNSTPQLSPDGGDASAPDAAHPEAASAPRSAASENESPAEESAPEEEDPESFPDAALPARTLWRRRAAAITAANVPSSPTPNGLLRRHRATTATPSTVRAGKKRTTNLIKKEDGDGDRSGADTGEDVSRLQSSQGLGAAVAAMEERKRAVEARRKEMGASDDQAASATSAVPAALSDAEVTGGEAWTINTGEISGSASSQGTFSPLAGSSGRAILSKRFSRYGASPATAQPYPRVGAEKHRIINFRSGDMPGAAVAAGSPYSSVSSLSSTRSTPSRSLSPMESAMLVEEGKKVLLAARQEKRDQERARLHNEQHQQEENPEDQPAVMTPGQQRRTDSPRIRGSPRARTPHSPMLGTPARNKSAAVTASASPSGKASPPSKLPLDTEETEFGVTAAVGAVPRSPLGFAPTKKSGGGVSLDPPAGRGRLQRQQLLTPGSKQVRCLVYVWCSCEWFVLWFVYFSFFFFLLVAPLARGA